MTLNSGVYKGVQYIETEPDTQTESNSGKRGTMANQLSRSNCILIILIITSVQCLVGYCKEQLQPSLYL